MPLTFDQVYEEALPLPLEARAALTERLVQVVAEEVPAEITRVQFDEMRRRIEQVESRELTTIPMADRLFFLSRS